MKIHAIEIPERRPGCLCIIDIAHVREVVSLPPAEVAMCRLRGEGLQALHDAPGAEHACRVGEDLNSGTDLADLRGSLEDGHVVARQQYGDGCS